MFSSIMASLSPHGLSSKVDFAVGILNEESNTSLQNISGSWMMLASMGLITKVINSDLKYLIIMKATNIKS